MNIAFFLTPKVNTVWIKLSGTMRQAMERMQYNRYSSVPLVDDDGKYAGTLTEGDLLWKLRECENGFKDTTNIQLADVPRHRDYNAVGIETEIEDIFQAARDQNFVPVVDCDGCFVGIIKRSDIISYCCRLLPSSEDK